MSKISLVFMLLLSFMVEAKASATISCPDMPPGATSAVRNQLANGGYGFCIITACGTNAQNIQLELYQNACLLPPTLSWFTTNQTVFASSVVLTVRAQLSRAPANPTTVALSTATSTASSSGASPDFKLLTPNATFSSALSAPIQIQLFRPATFRGPSTISLNFASVVGGTATLSSTPLLITLMSSIQVPLPVIRLSSATVVEGQAATMNVTLSSALSTVFPTSMQATITGPSGNVSPQIINIVIPRGQTAFSLSIPTIFTPGYQGVRTMTVTLSVSSTQFDPSSISSNTLTITDSTPTPQAPGVELGVTQQTVNGYVVRSSSAVNNLTSVNGYQVSGSIVPFAK